MSDDEEDYMSDKFLSSAADVRPSLIKDRAKQRLVRISEEKQELARRQRDERQTKLGMNRNELLQESLQRPIEEENKGFRLLAKMGYKPGQSLGKADASGAMKGIKEPLGMQIKMDRGGLGREAALKELAERRRELRQKRFMRLRDEAKVISTEEYQRMKAAQAEERFLLSVLRKCQITCENLDKGEQDLQTPSMRCFWPERITCEKDDEKSDDGDGDDDEEDDEDDNEFTTAEKVDLLTNYLRTAYHFCYWCGVRYKDADEIKECCPGTERDDH